MTAQADAPMLDGAEIALPSARVSAGVGRLLGWLGDWLNPILVKEARQALKSRQFVITFGLLLICGWVWSILGLAIIGPEAAYGVHGPKELIVLVRTDSQGA